jgi:hypothetical protein
VRRLAAALLLVTAGLLASPSAVPVYDGVGQPDEPYRYVGTANAPTPVIATVAVTKGGSAPLRLASPEKGPQVLVDLAAGAFVSPGRTVTLTATPLAGDGGPAPQGTVDGNVYRLEVLPGAVLQPTAANGYLFLRAAVMTEPDPVIVHRLRPADPWTTVPTTRAGRDILSTPLHALGDYAVVRLPGSVPLAEGAGLSGTRVALLVGGLLLLVTLTVLVLRRRPSEERAVTNP